MRKKTGTFCILLGIIMIFAAAGFAVYNAVQSKNAAEASSEILDAMKNSDESESTIDSSKYIGILKIPSLDIELPVMASWSYANLKTAPCRYYGSVETNDLVIAAHNYTRHFGKLSQIEIGADIQFTDVDGNIYNYTVGDIELLQPTDTEKMVQNDWDLTLYTCTWGAAKRVTVRCALK